MNTGETMERQTRRKIARCGTSMQKHSPNHEKLQLRNDDDNNIQSCQYPSDTLYKLLTRGWFTQICAIVAIFTTN